MAQTVRGAGAGSLDLVTGTTEPRTAVPEGLWAKLRADPVRAPEHIALAASEKHGPAADAWAAEKRRRFRHEGRELAEMAKRRHATLARFEGAATGVGGVITLVPDMVGLAWIQTRLVFFVAAAYGFDPRDPMRPAELLVLMELYDDVPSARAALDGAGKTIAEAYIGSKLEREEVLALRLAKMLGRRGMRRLAGRLIPFAAIVFNSVANERSTRALADRAIRFYGG
jgi:EcsC protein family